MARALLPRNEDGRLASLASLNLLDTQPEPELDALVRLAAAFCETPIALLSLVDRDRQWFKSRIGLDAPETSRDSSFCAHAILDPEATLVVADAERDARFSDNALVTGEPHIRFYAGVPLVTKNGAAIGTLCTIDRVPRTLTSHQLEALRAAASCVMMLLEKRNADARLRLLELVAVHASDGVAIISLDGERRGGDAIEYVNAALKTLTGFSEKEICDGDVGALLLELARSVQALPVPDGEQHATVTGDAAVVRKDGTAAEVEISVAPVLVDGDGIPAVYVVASLHDITDRRRVARERARAESATVANAELQHEIVERKRVEIELSHAASHDALTGLPNRLFFKQNLEEALVRDCGGGAARSNAVVFVDLDRFKKVNDSLGHVMGDRLLVAVAARLRSALRTSDIVARFAGDEFTVLLSDVRNEAEASVVVDRLARAFGEPFRLGSHDVFVTASIGAALVDTKHLSAEDVLRDPDIAMFAAKENGRARAQFFNQELDDRFSAAAHLEASLNEALLRGEFRLVYQPIVSLRAPNQPLQGFESLVRWNSPRGEIGPDTFIPAAEETGLIIPLGEWILNEACDRLAEWHAAYGNRAALLPTVSVNVSAKQFVNAQFVDTVDRAIARCGIDARYLALELTETTLMEDVDKGRAVLAAMRERGVKIYLDDFGTGYCSFSYLRRFAVDRLKIDRSFVSGGDGGDRTERLADPEIVRAIVTLAHSLDLETVAEGVETDAQRAALCDIGCDAAQGFFFSRPLADANGLLERTCANA